MSAEILEHTGLLRLYRLKRIGELHELPVGFREAAQVYLKGMCSWPSRHWELCDISREQAVKEAGFIIRFILEGFDED